MQLDISTYVQSFRLFKKTKSRHSAAVIVAADPGDSLAYVYLSPYKTAVFSVDTIVFCILSWYIILVLFDSLKKIAFCRLRCHSVSDLCL